ncbi:MAG TPA: cytochrome P460 family protein [Thermodesulfovibrionales bacterium]|nr:cytochrome P460 family protein [Thermodesulfovibrionales bacterium]
MKKVLVAVVSAVFILGFGYASYAIHDMDAQGTPVMQPEADAAKLYTYIMKPKPYFSRLKLWPGKRKLVSGNDPHGPLTTTYLNDTALSALSKGDMVDGSCIIMENYSADKRLETLTVMYKVKGYNPDAGDWFWVQYSSNNGYVLESGKVDSCIACHKSRQDTDYLHKERG